MRRLLILLATASLLVACAPKADLDKANAEVSRLTDEVASLKKLNDELLSKISALEQSQSELQAKLGQAAQQLSSAEQQLAKKPAIPVSVTFRPAMMGPGHVATFATTIKEDFPVLVTVKSKSLGTTQQFRLNLRASGVSELGHAEGATLEPQDELLIENQNYSPLAVSVVGKK